MQDDVLEAIDLVDSGNCSHVEWALLHKLYSALLRQKPTPHTLKLLSMIEPVLLKFGHHKD